MARGSLSPQRLCTGAIVILIVLALAPTRWTAPLRLDLLREPLNFVLQPISHPLRSTADRLRDDARQNTPNGRDSSTYRQLLERAEVDVARLRSENQRLRRQIVELQQGIELFPKLGVRPVAAPIVGTSSDLRTGVLIVGAGNDVGVLASSTIAVVEGAHLVGRVVSVASRSSTLQLITDKNTGIIDAVVTSDDLKHAWKCQVWPVGNGQFEGELATNATNAAKGDTVRLSDLHWPDAAQMRVLGVIESIDIGEKGHRRIRLSPVVRPERVSEVTLLIPVTQSDASATDTTSAPRPTKDNTP